jgi:hypothetical protein
MDALAKEVERRRHPLLVERLHRPERFIECLSGHEALREALGEPVVANESKNSLLVRQIQERLTEHDTSWKRRRSAKFKPTGVRSQGSGIGGCQGCGERRRHAVLLSHIPRHPPIPDP